MRLEARLLVPLVSLITSGSSHSTACVVTLTHRVPACLHSPLFRERTHHVDSVSSQIAGDIYTYQRTDSSWVGKTRYKEQKRPDKEDGRCWETNTEDVSPLPGVLGQQKQLLCKKWTWKDDPTRKPQDPKKARQKRGSDKPRAKRLYSLTVLSLSLSVSLFSCNSPSCAVDL